MDIPKEFKLFGQTIAVKMDAKLIHRENVVGEARYRENLITLQKNCKSYPTSREQTEQCFLHELVHYIFHALDEKDLVNNEKLVEQVSQLLHQYEKTRKGSLSIGGDK